MRRILPIFICLIHWLSAAPALAADIFAGGANTGGGSSNTFAANGEHKFLPVEQAYALNAEFENRDNQQQLRLNWDIAEGYYLYRHGFAFKLSAGGKQLPVNPVIPKGKEKHDKYLGRVEIYHRDIDIYLPGVPARKDLTLAVTSQGCAEAGLCYPPHTEYFHVDGQRLTVDRIANPGAAAAAIAKTESQAPTTAVPTIGKLLTMVLFAILGGITLNLMPCVFPVLSLKVLGFANDKGHSPVVHGLTYSAGVVMSFITVATVLVSLQAAGRAVGWGFQLQSPWFVAGLCYLFFLMGLSLSGYVEFGSQWMNIGGRLAAKTGYTGSFFTGVLATVVASPCSAPFMGTALGFAVTQTTPISLIIFAALGVGMALPILILSCSPALLRHIPKPGPWMETLKHLLAFPLYATSIWLAWVVGNQTGVNGMASVLLGCLLILIAMWFWRGKTLMRSVSAVCIALALVLLGSSFLKPNKGAAQQDQNWQAYTAERLHQLRARGKPVFVNITADWCITCLTNEKVTLSSDAVRQALRERGITYLKGDWTQYDPEITALLHKYGRTGIPLYLVYPAGNASRAHVLPQILTVNTVVKALADAARPVSLASHP